MNRRWLALAPLALFACAPAGTLSGPRATATPSASGPSAPTAGAASSTPPVAIASSKAASPPMQMSDARLKPSSCAEHADVVKSRIAAMRAEMDARYKEWHDMQPECWAEDRRREAERLERERCARTGNCGLGLSGIGSGGGGYGEGIGLGSIGTIGHGSGTGVGTAQITSKTNVQVAGVDEPDIVKTDGRYVYMVANGALRIVEALTAKPVSTTRVQGHANDMVVEGDRLVVFVSNGERAERCTYGYDCDIAGDGTSTTIVTYDIADRSTPKKVRTIGLTGSLMTARRIGSTVHAVVADGDSAVEDLTTWPEDVEMCGTREDVLQKKFFALRAKNERSIRAATSLPTITDQGATKDLCMGLLESRFDKSHTFTTVVSFDMNDATAKATSSTIRSRPGVVYASNDALYVATHRRKNRSLMWYTGEATSDEVTEIHKFRLGARPTDTRYLGSGVTQGHVLNTFAMDERAGDLRIATSRGKTPDPHVESQVDVLRQGPDGNLSRVGALLHLAKGEDLRAIRYDDDRAYLVTFKKTDPLFVVDLADAKAPKVLGELKIPGFSTYIHRLDKNHLLSIGFDANDHGDFAFFDGVLLQLFDVTNPTEPKLLHRKKLGARGSSSAATSDHHAFNYLPEKSLLAIPLTECAGGGDGVAGSEVAFAGLALFRVSNDKGFEHLGGVAHEKGRAHCGQWWSRSTTDVKRSVFVDDLVYSMATDRLKVQRMGALGKDVADLRLAP